VLFPNTKGGDMGPAIIGLICGGAFGLSIAALILIGACKIAGLRTPNFFPAMLICFCVFVAVSVIQLGAGAAIAVASGGMPRGAGAAKLVEVANHGAVVGLIASPFVSAGIFSVMLEECSYLRGLLVWFCQFVVILLFVLVMYFIALAFKVGTPRAEMLQTLCWC